jgi:asparagine synthase (glutamine-hydrolysing)
VAVSGLGADELFGGYPSFRDIPFWVRTLAIPSRVPGLGDLARQMLTAFHPDLNPKAAGLIKLGGSYPSAYLARRGLFMPWELPELLGDERTRIGLRRLKPMQHVEALLKPTPKKNFGKVSSLESGLYMRNQLLRDTDWASMAHSIEVRVPFVDIGLLRQVAQIAAQPAVRMSKQVLAGAPSRPLPAAILNRPKTGFGTPLHMWLKEARQFDKWQAVPKLAADQCPWARRWAFEMLAV